MFNIETKSYPDPLQKVEYANNADKVITVLPKPIERKTALACFSSIKLVAYF